MRPGLYGRRLQQDPPMAGPFEGRRLAMLRFSKRWEITMTYAQSALRGAILLGMVALSSACIVAEHDGYRERDGYREGYYDRDHHRYYHDHGWRECGERDEHCR